jgi:Domain of unknown function (DUF4340)
VETPVTKRRRAWLATLVAVAAFAFIVFMIYEGAVPRREQLIEFHAKGLLQPGPQRVTRVEIDKGEKKIGFVRAKTGWLREPDQQPAAAKLAEVLTMATQFMHTAAPVQEVSKKDYPSGGIKEFGLDQPRISVTLWDGNTPILTAHFGGNNPTGILQYMKLEGRDEVYVMSGFVGSQWEKVAAGD